MTPSTTLSSFSRDGHELPSPGPAALPAGSVNHDVFQPYLCELSDNTEGTENALK